MRQYFWGMEETGNRLELRGNIRYRFLPAKIFSPIFFTKMLSTMATSRFAKNEVFKFQTNFYFCRQP